MECDLQNNNNGLPKRPASFPLLKQKTSYMQNKIIHLLILNPPPSLQKNKQGD